MPGKLKVHIAAARNLPVMDRASDLTDAFVEVKLGNTVYKTEVFKKSLNPQWNSDWFRFEVDDEELQDEPLQIRVLDYDTYSSHDAIGKVYIDLNPLLSRSGSSVISGWFPIYDTVRGIRGDLNLTAKLELFSDFNKFRQSSCGIQFFTTPCIPHKYRLLAIHGFVEELVVNDDPEYQWIDRIRSMRSSNEARQMLFSKMSGELQRKIGVKVLEMGGNSVLGYQQCFDLEGETGIVVRAIGTAVTISRNNSGVTLQSSSISPSAHLIIPEEGNISSSPFSANMKALSSSPPKCGPGIPIRRMSESEITTSPKGDSGGGSCSSSLGAGTRPIFHRPITQQQSIDMMEYPFFTMTLFPPGFLVHLGGVVSARSVKLLDRIHNPDEPETRDAWWMELRTEIRSHAHSMSCHAVIGYSETASICGEIIVLSACGTAATVNMSIISLPQPATFPVSLERAPPDKRLHVDVNLASQASSHRHARLIAEINPQCALCHIPYSESSLPFPTQLSKCTHCRRHKVPDVLFTTIEPPLEFSSIGKGCFIQARICRQKKECKGEANAKDISDNLPFMEYELHSQLINKLKVKGMNCLFGLKIQFIVGQRLLVAVATGTAVLAGPLPEPALPRLIEKGKNSEEQRSICEAIEKQMRDTVQKNKEMYKLHNSESDTILKKQGNLEESTTECLANDEEIAALNRDTFLLEIDDIDDIHKICLLLDHPIPDGVYLCNTHHFPGVAVSSANVQTLIACVWRGQLAATKTRSLCDALDDILKRLMFKLRSVRPLCLYDLNYNIDLPDDELQVTVTALCAASCGEYYVKHSPHVSSAECDVLDGDQEENMLFDFEMTSDCFLSTSQKAVRIKAENRRKAKELIEEHTNIEITTLSHVIGAEIQQYLGYLNFFIIRETTSLREHMGNLNGFVQSFLTEVLAIGRAHVNALGGNALVSFKISECLLDANINKNQSQCLFNICGDVVLVRELNSVSDQLESITDQWFVHNPISPSSISSVSQEQVVDEDA